MPEPPRVLLVFEDAAFAGALEKTFRENGFDPASVKSGAEALEALPGGRFSAVVSAQLLKGMDGVELCKKIKVSRKELPVVLLAAVSSSAGVNDVRKTSGADVVYPRAFSGEALVGDLRRRTGLSGGARPEVTPSRPMARPQTTPRPAPPPDASPRSAATSSQASPAEALSSIDPAWIFGQSVAGRATGALRMARAGVERTIHFDNGTPVVATSNVPSERIGQILVAKGMIGAGELERFLALAQKGGIRLVEVLVRQGVLTATEQTQTIQGQYVERILACFAWAEAAVEFRPQPPPTEEIPVPLPVGRLLTEGMRRHYDLARLMTLLTPERVLHRAPGAERLLPELGFDEVETAAFLAVDGVRQVGAIAAVEATRAASLRALHAGICLRLIT